MNLIYAYLYKYKSQRAPWLRAAILGLNDGLVSTSSTMLGVGGGSKEDNATDAMFIAGIAALVAGSLAMACGKCLFFFKFREIKIKYIIPFFKKLWGFLMEILGKKKFYLYKIPNVKYRIILIIIFYLIIVIVLFYCYFHYIYIIIIIIIINNNKSNSKINYYNRKILFY